MTVKVIAHAGPALAAFRVRPAGICRDRGGGPTVRTMTEPGKTELGKTEPGKIELSALPEFIGWLTGVIESHPDMRAKLGSRLGPGGAEQINRDLSGGYLPAWRYVERTYLDSIQAITGEPFPADQKATGRKLYDEARKKAVAYRPSDPQQDSYSRIVAPLLAGFTLPTIVILATLPTDSQTTSQTIALACFIAATGCFMASFQLTIGWVYTDVYGLGRFRAGLTFAGIALLVVALMVLVAALPGHWWADAALGILVLGALTAAISQAWRWLNSGKENGLPKRLLARLRRRGHHD